MRQYCALGLAMLVGSVLGAATVTALQAQAKPPIYLVSEIEVTIRRLTAQSSHRRLMRLSKRLAAA